MKSSKIEIQEKLINALETAGYKNVSLEYNRQSKLIELSFFGHDKVKIYCITKNIVNSGWADKPLIKRIQLSKFDSSLLPISTFKETAIIIGYIHILDKDMFIFWSFYRNISHNTNRSCYVTVKSLFKGYLDGFYRPFESGQNVWITDSLNIKKALYDYMKRHYTSTENNNEHLE